MPFGKRCGCRIRADLDDKEGWPVANGGRRMLGKKKQIQGLSEVRLRR